METTATRIYPGDIISAMGLSFTVWFILYQECSDGVYDVEFLDSRNQYHHWKQEYDGGTVIHSGIPGHYFREVDGSRIACIRPRRNGTGYTARIMEPDGNECWLGSCTTEEQAVARIARHAGSNWTDTWQEM